MSEIALRCYNLPKFKKAKKFNVKTKIEIPDRILFFDTETTIDEYQNLNFGYFEIYNRGKLQNRGLFYNPGISKYELKVLKEYSKTYNIKLYPVRKFVDRIFYPEIYDLKSLCVGFNLPFDLSRLAISFNTSKKEHNAFTFKLSDKTYYPRLIIKHLDSKISFIKFTNGFSGVRGNFRHKRGRPNRFRGNFLDLKTLAFALTNESHSLESACIKFDTEIKKTKSENHGKITPEYIEYNINDVRSTYNLYLKLKSEFDNYKLNMPSTRVYSPASIGKGYLKAMGVKPFLEKNPNFPKEILGYMMSTYYGGRSEVRYRKKPIEIKLIDFLSMYPTVCTLQELWKFVIADKIRYKDDTERVKEFVNNIALEDMRNPEIWKKFNVIALVLPENDILPVRSKYGNKETYNIGINYLSSSTPIWYTLSDIIDSKLLTGKSPMILKAIRFEPRGVQNELKSIRIVGNKEFNPYTEDLFKSLIEYRVKVKRKRDNAKNESDRVRFNNLQNNIKIIANATSYGIYVEINTETKKNTNLDIYGLENFQLTSNKVENFGKAFNPILAISITSASRLILAITERILQDNNSFYTFCDTDSMAIEPKMVRPIQDFFKPLNPYSFDKPLFELEKENFNKISGKPESLYFYGISPKRYVLYNMEEGKPIIRKHSSHGLGHLLNPFTNVKDWDKTIWEDILNELYEIANGNDIDEKYQNKFCISQLTITSPEIMKRLKILNKNKPYNKQIKPFNFVLVGTANLQHPKTRNPVKPIKPFTKYIQNLPFEPFLDYNSGETFYGLEYWKPFDYVFWEYKNHPEDKFNGDLGLMDRKYVIADRIIYIGKESNKLEENQILGSNNKSYSKFKPKSKPNENQYLDNSKFKDLIFKLKPKQTIQYDISKKQLTRMRNRFTKNGILKLSRKIKNKMEFLYQKYSELDSQ